MELLYVLMYDVYLVSYVLVCTFKITSDKIYIYYSINII